MVGQWVSCSMVLVLLETMDELDGRRPPSLSSLLLDTVPVPVHRPHPPFLRKPRQPSLTSHINSFIPRLPPLQHTHQPPQHKRPT